MADNVGELLTRRDSIQDDRERVNSRIKELERFRSDYLAERSTGEFKRTSEAQQLRELYGARTRLSEEWKRANLRYKSAAAYQAGYTRGPDDLYNAARRQDLEEPKPRPADKRTVTYTSEEGRVYRGFVETTGSGRKLAVAVSPLTDAEINQRDAARLSGGYGYPYDLRREEAKNTGRNAPDLSDYALPLRQVAIEQVTATPYSGDGITNDKTPFREATSIVREDTPGGGFWDRSPGAKSTVTTTLTATTPASRIAANLYITPKIAKQSLPRTSGLANPASYEFQSSYETVGDSIITRKLKTWDARVANTRPMLWLNRKVEARVEKITGAAAPWDNKTDFGLFIEERATKKPVTTAAQVTALALSKKAPLLAPIMRGTIVSDLVAEYNRDASPSRFYENPRFRGVVAGTEYAGESYLWVFPDKERAKDMLTLDSYGTRVRSNLYDAGFRGQELIDATRAAKTEKRTQQRAIGAGIVIGAEGAGNVVGGTYKKYFAAKFAQTSLKPSTQAAAAGFFGIGLGGFAEGVTSSVVIDRAERRPVSFKRAAIAGGVGFVTAGSIGGLVEFGAAKIPTWRTGLEQAAAFADPLAEQAGDIASYAATPAVIAPTPAFSRPGLTQTKTFTTLPAGSIQRAQPFARSPTPSPAPSSAPSNAFTSISAPSISTAPTWSPTPAPAFTPTTSPSSVISPSVTPALSVSDVSTSTNTPASVPAVAIVPTGDIPFPIFPFELGGRKRRKGTRRPARRFRYTADFASLSLGIKAPKIRTPRGGFTGFEARPLISPLARKRKGGFL